MNERNQCIPPLASQEGRIPKFLGVVLWSLTLIYFGARFLQLSGRVPLLVVIALHVLTPLTFALLHGAILYRIRGILIFVGLFLLIGNLFENLSVLTGFPFGHYYFTKLMGPKIFNIPIFLGLAYLGMAYLSWTLARLILRTGQGPISGFSLVLVPVLSGLIMTAWDLSQDPSWSTILHLWIWPHGGAYFGVPVSNFLGWYFTNYVIFQTFAFYLLLDRMEGKALPSSYWRLAVLFYGVSAAGNLLRMIPRAGFEVVTDPAGVQWNVRGITTAGALVSIFIMGSFAFVAWLRVPQQNAQAPAGRIREPLIPERPKGLKLT